MTLINSENQEAVAIFENHRWHACAHPVQGLHVKPQHLSARLQNAFEAPRGSGNFYTWKCSILQYFFHLKRDHLKRKMCLQNQFFSGDMWGFGGCKCVTLFHTRLKLSNQTKVLPYGDFPSPTSTSLHINALQSPEQPAWTWQKLPLGLLPAFHQYAPLAMGISRPHSQRLPP